MKKHYLLLCLLMASCLAQATVFTNASAITINDNAAAATYPSNLTVSGLPGYINSIQVTIHGLTHAYVSDVSLLLQSPSGQSLLLQSFCADGAAASNLTYTFSDAASSPLSNSTIWTTNTSYKPTAYMWDVFPAPAPLTPPGIGTYNAPGPFGPQTATLASTFNGLNPNGTWKLFVADFASGDAGTINGGWSLNITTSNVALPLSAISLQAVNRNNMANLQWTLSGNHYQYAVVEESTNGID